MELSTSYPSMASLFFPHNFVLENYVHWTQTLESHIYTVNLPGVRKEEVKVEVEDSRYLIIRTQKANDESTEPAKRFTRKFRLPDRVDMNGISAGYEDGVLTVTVPRSSARRMGFYVEAADLPENLNVMARAA